MDALPWPSNLYWSDLVIAACQQSDEFLREYLEAGFDPNWAENGYTLLQQAAFAESVACVQALLAAGACVGCSANGNDTPLNSTGCIRVARMLIDAGARCGDRCGVSPLFAVAARGDVEMLALLLDDGGGLNCLHGFDEMGYTALGLAAQRGQAEAVKLLLSRGADPDLCDPDWIAYSPLTQAVWSGSVETVEALLRAGADPDHAWGLCSSGREAMIERGGVMLDLLESMVATKSGGLRRSGKERKRDR